MLCFVPHDGLFLLACGQEVVGHCLFLSMPLGKFPTMHIRCVKVQSPLPAPLLTSMLMQVGGIDTPIAASIFTYFPPCSPFSLRSSSLCNSCPRLCLLSSPFFLFVSPPHCEPVYSFPNWLLSVGFEQHRFERLVLSGCATGVAFDACWRSMVASLLAARIVRRMAL